LHQNNFNIVLHFRDSKDQATILAEELNRVRENSIVIVQANFSNIDNVKELAAVSLNYWGRINVLINNASSFYPTPIGNTTEQDWDALINSNLKAPFFLIQELASELKKQKGCVINIADIYAEKPLQQHTIYSVAKAGNVMLTKSFAQELAPDVRVNGIAPGAILWPEKSGENPLDENATILSKTPLNTLGKPNDIAKTVLFLIQDAPYITGQIITVDGGRTLTI
ncbi:MAG: pteridine reductase, partial [Chitinophagaceae bacterium]